MLSSLFASVFLICLSALFSGLTLGLMGLDKVGLQIVIESGQRNEVQGHCMCPYSAMRPFAIPTNLHTLLCYKIEQKATEPGARALRHTLSAHK